MALPYCLDAKKYSFDGINILMLSAYDNIPFVKGFQLGLSVLD